MVRFEQAGIALQSCVLSMEVENPLAKTLLVGPEQLHSLTSPTTLQEADSTFYVWLTSPCSRKVPEAVVSDEDGNSILTVEHQSWASKHSDHHRDLAVKDSSGSTLLVLKRGYFSMIWELGAEGADMGKVNNRALLKGWSLPIVGRSFEIKLCAPDAGKEDGPLLVLTGTKGSRNCEVKTADDHLYAKVTCNASQRSLRDKLRGHITYQLELPAGSDLAVMTALVMRVHYECICGKHHYYGGGGG